MELSNRSPAVDVFLREFAHPLSDSIQSLRLAILDGNPWLTEAINWKAPSFRFGDVD